MKKKKQVLLTAAAILSAMLAGCSILPAEEELPQKPLLNEAYLPNYETIKVQRGTIDTSIEKKVSYKASAVENLSFDKDGILSNLYVAKGDLVRKGNLLAELDCAAVTDTIADYRLQLSENTLQKEQLLQQREMDLKGVELQMEQNLSLQKEADEQQKKQLAVEYDSLQTRYSSIEEQYSQQLQRIEDAITVLQLRLEQAESELAQMQIVAPIDGVITSVSRLLSGDEIHAGKQVLRIESTDTAYFSCDEALFAIGKEYTAELAEGSQLTLVAIANGEEETNWTDLLRPVNEDVYLTDKTVASVTIPGEVHEDVLYTKAEALYEREGGYYVYVLNEQGRSESRDVEIGLISGIWVEITSGLEEGEEVVV